MEVFISVITVNYNGFKDTCALIDSIPSDDSIEVIVVDNASVKDEATQICQLYPNVHVIRSTQNLGFAGGNNLGLKAAKGKYLYLVNNDTVLKGSDSDKHKSLQIMINRLESSPTIGMVCPKILFAWPPNPIQFAGYTPLSRITIRNKAIGCGEEDRGQYQNAHSTPYAHGAAMMIKRDALESVGFMPECYFLYYEELDWSMMFTQTGYEIWYEPTSIIYHKESQTTGTDSSLKTYYITRNRLLFVKRNIQKPIKWLSYSYLIGLVAIRDILKYTLKRRFDLVKATNQGIIDFVFKL